MLAVPHSMHGSVDMQQRSAQPPQGHTRQPTAQPRRQHLEALGLVQGPHARHAVEAARPLGARGADRKGGVGPDVVQQVGAVHCQGSAPREGSQLGAPPVEPLQPDKVGGQPGRVLPVRWGGCEPAAWLQALGRGA